MLTDGCPGSGLPLLPKQWAGLWLVVRARRSAASDFQKDFHVDLPHVLSLLKGGLSTLSAACKRRRTDPIRKRRQSHNMHQWGRRAAKE